MTSSASANYADVASEYYDSTRHPTCANFRTASCQMLTRWLPGAVSGNGWACEVGPGRSLVAELVDRLNISLDHLVLIDAAPLMLDYSREYSRQGVGLFLGEAGSLPLQSETCGLLVASLGDPYNDLRFWEEVSRVLVTGGQALFTTPSNEWASGFRERNRESQRSAEFELSDGSLVRVPSLIHSPEVQKALIEECGLEVLDVESVSASSLCLRTISPKLAGVRSSHSAIVTGYSVLKPA